MEAAQHRSGAHHKALAESIWGVLFSGQRQHRLPPASRLEYKRMGSYTAFKVSSMAQVGEAVETIRGAAIRTK